ncbi:MAG: GNAT family N-acetyltransferase [Methanoregulaceae archaeon]|nr:GNAT family N-acetyltransferase [Methanoregulaceae archaeon]
MTIRRAHALDAPAIQDLIKSVYDEYGFSWDPEGYHMDLYNFEEHFSDPHGAYWVAEEAGQILGGGGVEAYPPHPGEPGTLVDRGEGLLVCAGADCELVRMYLRSDQRGRGIGKLLFNEILSWAKAQGCQKMEIWSDVSLTLAHPFYRAFGATDIGKRVCNDPDQAVEYGFILNLT